jgi:uncharacterized protein with PIN domain
MVIEAAIETDPVLLMSTASYLETAVVIESRFGEPGGRELDLWLHRAAVDLVAVHPDQAEAARVAYCEYGKRSRTNRSDRSASCCVSSTMDGPRGVVEALSPAPQIAYRGVATSG